MLVQAGRTDRVLRNQRKRIFAYRRSRAPRFEAACAGLTASPAATRIWQSARVGAQQHLLGLPDARLGHGCVASPACSLASPTRTEAAIAALIP